MTAEAKYIYKYNGRCSCRRRRRRQPVVLLSSKLCQQGMHRHQRAPNDPASQFLGDLTSGAICCLPNKRDLLRSTDRCLHLSFTSGYHRANLGRLSWEGPLVADLVRLRLECPKGGTGTVITRVTVRKWRGSYPRNRKAEPRGILYV